MGLFSIIRPGRENLRMAEMADLGVKKVTILLKGDSYYKYR